MITRSKTSLSKSSDPSDAVGTGRHVCGRKLNAQQPEQPDGYPSHFSHTYAPPPPARLPLFMACDERGLAALLVSSILRSKPLFFIISAGNYAGALPSSPPLPASPRRLSLFLPSFGVIEPADWQGENS
jgi:hypothetical protein